MAKLDLRLSMMMSVSDPYQTLIPDARAFLTELSANNNRDWFNAHKANYESNLKAPAGYFLEQIAADLARLTGHTPKYKQFRMHRDLRFSKDKTPYTTHLHLAWSTQIGSAPRNGWFFGVSPEYVSIGGGLMTLDKPALQRWREAVSGARGAALATGLEALLAQGFRSDPPALKRVPTPYDKAHPQGALLRRKSLTLWIDIAPNVKDLAGELNQQFARLWPFQQALAGLF